MRRILTLAAVLVSLSLWAQMPHESGEIIIQLSPNGNPDQIVEDLAEVGGEATGLSIIKELSKPMAIWHLKFNESNIDEQTMLRLVKQHPGVQLAQFNHFVEKRETVPNDPSYGQQWHHENIDSELAWDITTGGETVFGDEIVVCVIEGGNLNHPDLDGNRWVNENEIPDNGIDDDNNGYVDDYLGWDVTDENDNFAPNNGHGTNVFGMIGAKGDNGANVTGINWDVKMMGIGGYNIFNEANIVECYTYPLVQRQLYRETGGERGAFVVATNASWGIDQGDMNDVPIWEAFYDTLGVHGILNCGATSNSALNIDQVGDIPTASESDYMIAVTATNSNDQRTFSGFGQTTIDLGAPGDDVVTTSGSNGITSTSGTSFASPLTAGAIALLYSTPCPSFGALLASNPQGAADYIREALFAGVDPVASLQTECVTGGRLNVANSVQIIMDQCSFDECLAPFEVVATETSPAVYNISWSSFGDVQGSTVRYREVGAAEWTSISTAETSLVFEDLLMCTEYEFQVSNSCEDGESAFSDSLIFTTNGCCELPSTNEIIVSDIGNEEATITWPFVLAATSLLFEIVDEDGTAVVVSDLTGTSYTFTSLEPCMSYDVSISIDCSGDVLPFGSTVAFQTFGCGACTDLNYCSSQGGGDEEWIDGVKVNDQEEYVTGSDGGYGDFTGVLEPWEMVIGSNSIDLTPGFEGNQTFPERWRVWIDYNQDGSFDADEEVFDESSQDPVTAQIDIPEGTMLGNTRMRIGMKWGGFGQAPPIPCLEAFDFGEVEDYCVRIDNADNVFESELNAFAIYPNPTNGLIRFEPVVNASARVIDLQGRDVMEIDLSNGQADLSELEAGMYTVVVPMASGVSSTRVVVR